MISQQRAEELANKILKNTISSEEEQEWREWYQSNLDEPIAMPESFALSKAVHAARMMNVINGAISVKRKVRLWPRIAVAAAAIATIVFGVWFFNSRTGSMKQVQAEVAFKNEIAPGKNTATLTLPNGKTIDLSDTKTGVVIGASKITYNDNTLVSDVSTGDPSSRTEGSALSSGGKELSGLRDDELITASTPRGGTYQVTLPDGTRVWLNAESKISFPSKFNGKERKVLLQGEGYFEVVHNAKQPFRVASRGQVVEDIGTAFNINAYADELSIKTTLLEGSAKVNDVILKPNQQSVISGAGKLVVKEVEASDVVLWKSGKFSFASEAIGDIMRQVSRWYDVEVIFEDKVQQVRVTGSVSRFANISVLLEKLEQTGLVHFRVVGRKVYVSKN